MEKIIIVVPCYNEQEVLPETAKRLKEFLDRNTDVLSPDSRVLFVDDGSRDDTWKLICELCDTSERFEGLRFAHNAGHQNAVWAGMEAARGRCDAVVSIDADLQDDVDAMRRFVDAYIGGTDIVYGVRSKRETDSFFKRVTAEGFYRFMSALGCETVYNHADYRLLSSRALEALLSYQEVNLFLRGMVPTLGFRTEKVYYERYERFAGRSHYPLGKMLALALKGITAFSVRPLRLIALCGALIIVLSLIAGIADLFIPGAYPGFTAFSVWFACGLILTALGIVGEYVGMALAEARRRPKYIVMEKRLK